MLLIVHNWCNLIACNVCMHAHIYVLHADTRLCNVQGLRFRSKRFGFEGHRSEIRPQNWFWPITPKRAKFLQKIVNQCCESWNTKKKQNKMSDFLRSKQRTGKGRRKSDKKREKKKNGEKRDRKNLPQSRLLLPDHVPRSLRISLHLLTRVCGGNN